MENLTIKKIKIKINTEQKIDKNKEEIINVFRNNVRGRKFEKDPIINIVETRVIG